MKRAVLAVLALVASVVPAVLSWTAVAALDPGFLLQAVAALGAFMGVAWLLLAGLARRGLAPASRRPRGTWVAVGALAYAATAHLAVGRPPTRTLSDLQPLPGVEEWTLDDGGRIAFLRVSASEDPARDPGRRGGEWPIVWLHDGPGLPILPMLRDPARRPLAVAAREGFDVVFYDQRGSGFSSRLDLRREGPYGVEGHVADLERVRERLGVERMILAGHGWGASLAAAYLLAHPDRVDRMILLSPAPLWYPAWEDFVAPAARARISEVQASALALLERPTLRLMIGRLTASTSRAAAHALVTDWEADQWWTDVTREAWRLGQPKPTCADRPPGGAPVPEGLGFFAYSYTSADALARPDPRPALASQELPVVILRGLCDWVTTEVANEYLEVFPGAQYVAVPGAGHLLWLEMPALQERVLADFLAGRPLPLAFFHPR